jgi:hypothetical protein
MNEHPPHRRRFYPVRVEIAPRVQSIRAAAGASADQHLLKPAAGQAILTGIPPDCHHPAAASIGQELAERAEAMKTFTIAAVILSMLAVPAHAQGKRPHGGDEKKAKDDRPKVDEKAYKAALERIPEPKEKYDPWAVTKPVEPAKKPK